MSTVSHWFNCLALPKLWCYPRN